MAEENNIYKKMGFPTHQGLYDPKNEHDACGFGFITNIDNVPKHKIVHQALDIVHKLDHRGAIGADPLAGDGAGILIQIPDEFFRMYFNKYDIELPPVGEFAVGMVFLPNDKTRSGIAKKAIELGLTKKPWVKSSLAPGSQVVDDYLEAAGLQTYLDDLGFNIVGHGCTTCIGNSGPLIESVGNAVDEEDLVVSAVLSGNRNFEGRVHQQVKASFLASPMLVVSYALAGTVNIDLENEPVGYNSKEQPIYLKDIWPSHEEVRDTMNKALNADMFIKRYSSAFEGDTRWQNLPVPTGNLYNWDPTSTYIQEFPIFEDISLEPDDITDISNARVFAVLGDSITTDHISPAGGISISSPAAEYLQDKEVSQKDFNSYGSRRGNYAVMVPGTFANIRLRNGLAPDKEGGYTTHFPTGEVVSLFEAAQRYKSENTPLVVLAGKEYGSGSSRDWAAKGPFLLGVRAVIAETYERIHRSNLIGMGVIPLQYLDGENKESLNLEGNEIIDIHGLADNLTPGKIIDVTATKTDGSKTQFKVKVRIDANIEVDYYHHGGVLQYVLRKMVKEN